MFEGTDSEGEVELSCPVYGKASEITPATVAANLNNPVTIIADSLYHSVSPCCSPICSVLAQECITKQYTAQSDPIYRAHSFPRAAEFQAELQNLPFAVNVNITEEF